MPAEHDLDPPAMTDDERRAKRRYQAGHAFEQMPGPLAPKRIQLSRAKGWRKPEGVIVVARPSMWGNPFTLVTGCQSTAPASRAIVAALFRRDLLAAIERPWTESHTIEFRIIAESLDVLRGRDLACWCPLDQPCHADVLLELANR